MRYLIELYETPNGRHPVDDFIAEIRRKNKLMLGRVTKDLDLLERYGRDLSEPKAKHIEDGIFELRSKCPAGITRIFYFFYSGNKIILTNGFIKKTQATPRKELEKAKRYKKDYEAKS